jgi:hypothetical protein
LVLRLFTTDFIDSSF